MLFPDAEAQPPDLIHISSNRSKMPLITHPNRLTDLRGILLSALLCNQSQNP